MLFLFEINSLDIGISKLKSPVIAKLIVCIGVSPPFFAKSPPFIPPLLPFTPNSLLYLLYISFSCPHPPPPLPYKLEF